MTEIGIVGAGAAGAALAFELDRTLPEAALTVLEKSSGVGGRAATRRREDCTYEYGANYLKSDDGRVVELVTETLDTTGLVDVDEPIYTFDQSGEVAPGRDADDRKWTYRSGLTQLSKRLFDRTAATVHHETRVETVVRGDETAAGDSDAAWRLRDSEGSTWGPFDALVLTPAAPQTATLLETAEWESQVRSDLVDAAADVPFRTIWTAILHYEFELDVPYYALVNTDREHEVGWIAREECKPGHVPDGESLLVVQAAPGWSREHAESSPAANVATLASHAADLVGDDRLRDPDWTDHQDWHYALPDDAVAPDPIRDATEEQLYCAGDWVAGEGRLHAALANGLDVGEQVARDLSG